MLSSPTPADRRPARGLASSALRSAGLIDHDTRMRDATKEKDRAGGKKTSTKKIGHRFRVVDIYKDAAGPSRSHLLASRIAAADPLSIRGAAVRPIPGRPRKIDLAQAAAGPSGINHRTTPNTLDIWREFVKRRWNVEARFLNLERMIDDEVLKKYNIVPPGLPGSSPREMAVIFKLASQLKPDVQTISLAHNNFESGKFLSSIGHYIPQLSNLSLQDNRIRTWRDLDFISGRKDKLTQLRELILIGNPIRDFEFKNNRAEHYRNEIARRFPTLEVLDQEVIAKISFNVPLASTSSVATQQPTVASFTLPMAPSFITGVENTLISNFLVRFFGFIDNQRSALADVYTQEATFSYSVTTVNPPRARTQRLNQPGSIQSKLDWSPWLNNDGGSRNLTRLGGGLEKTIKSLHIGPDAIIKVLLSLPATKHEVAGSSEKFCIDAWPIEQNDIMMLFVTVHGEFAEAPSQGLRSFDRSLILAPAQEGSRAKLAQWDVVILSDQLIVRTYSSPEAWTPGPLKTQWEDQGVDSTQFPPQSQLVQQLTPEAQARFNGEIASIPEPQRTLVLSICQRTNLNVKFAIDCLEGNTWDIERAVANFEQVKSGLAPDAFL